MRPRRITIVIDQITGQAPGLTRRALEMALRRELGSAIPAELGLPQSSLSRARASAELDGAPTARKIAAATMKGISS